MKVIEIERIVVSKRTKSVEKIYRIKQFSDPNNWTMG
jgi:hypothetical protein